MSKTPDLLSEGLSFASLEVHVNRPLWAPGPAWVVVAGSLACGAGALLDWETFLKVLVLAFLVDPIWGGLWRLALRWPGEPVQEYHGRRQRGVPYLREGSPAHRVGRWLDALQMRSARSSGVLQAFLVSLSMGVVLSVGLSRTAVYATLVAALAALVARALRRCRWLQGVVLSASQFALPWALAVKTFDGRAETLVLGGLWTVTHILVIGADTGSWGRRLVLAGQIVLVTWFVWLRQPVAAALLTTVFLPTWLGEDESEWQGKLGVWWSIALLVSSVALNFG